MQIGPSKSDNFRPDKHDEGPKRAAHPPTIEKEALRLHRQQGLQTSAFTISDVGTLLEGKMVTQFRDQCINQSINT